MIIKDIRLIDMKEIVVLSGKGGTGKTTIVASLAALAKNKVLVDCDVDAADLFLLLQPKSQEVNEFWSGHVAVIDENKCTKCSLCGELCRFDAINEHTVNSTSCEGCGFCFHICPENAIIMNEKLSGHWFISETDYGSMVHAKLGIGQENSGRLVTVVRQQANRLAQEKNINLIISDGPPGTGCPVISSLSGATLALIVTEPSLSGMHDLDRILDVCHHFGVSPLVCINKYDLNEENSSRIEKFCSTKNTSVISKISFDTIAVDALVHHVPIVEYSKSRIDMQIRALWQSLCNLYTLQD